MVTPGLAVALSKESEKSEDDRAEAIADRFLVLPQLHPAEQTRVRETDQAIAERDDAMRALIVRGRVHEQPEAQRGEHGIEIALGKTIAGHAGGEAEEERLDEDDVVESIGHALVIVEPEIVQGDDEDGAERDRQASFGHVHRHLIIGEEDEAVGEGAA